MKSHGSITGSIINGEVLNAEVRLKSQHVLAYSFVWKQISFQRKGKLKSSQEGCS
jgi:hypothetical protein